jgi:hypothetical protein
MKVRCEICQELFATVDPLLIEAPFSGRDFGSIDPGHGVPPPWHPILTFVDMRCPYGAHRPFLAPDRLLLETGEYLELNGRGGSPPSPPAPDEGESPGLPGPVEAKAPSSSLQCPTCGKECGSPIGLVSHMRTHKEVKS